MKKAFKITGIVLAALLLVLILSPLLFKDRIRQEVKNLANRSLKSELNFTGMQVSFFSHFPHLSLTLTGFSLKSAPPFNSDTLLSAKEVGLGIDVLSLFRKTILINRIYLDEARVNILYNEQGAANYDVYQSGDTVQAQQDTTSGGAELRIEHITFSHARVVYSDRTLPLLVVAGGLDYSGKSNLTGDIFDLTSEVGIEALDVSYGDWKVIDSKPVTARLSTKVNTKDLTINFEKNDLKVKDIPLQFHGKFNFEKGGYQVNLNFLSVMEKEFLSARFRIRQSDKLWLFARANASIDLGKWARALDVKTAEVRGLYELNLSAEGDYVTGPVSKGIRNETDTVILSIPQFSLMTRLTGGYFKYASLPQALKDISFTLNASCPDNNYDNIGVQLENLNANFLNNKVAGYLKLDHLTEPYLDVNLSSVCNLAELKQVVPLDSISLSGNLALDIKAKGSYAPEKKRFPVTTALISLKDGSVLTNYYPHPLEKIDLKAEAESRGGTMKDLVVRINPLVFHFEGKPFTLKANLENFDDLMYDVQSKGEIDLGKVYKVFSQKGLDLDGYIETDLSLKGRQSDATAGRYEKLSNKGILRLKNIGVTTEYYPRPFIIRTGDFRFDQDRIRFENFIATYGGSDLNLKGSVSNTLNYILSKGGVLKGDFRLQSRFISVDEFMAFSSADTISTAPATQDPGVVILPRDLDIDFAAAVNRVAFNGLDIRDLKGKITLKDGILVLSETAFALIGCQVKMDATYGSIDAKNAFFDFHVEARDFDIKRAYNEVAMIRELAPSAGKAEGIVSLDYSVKGRLGADMFPVLPSLEGGGVFSVKKVKVYGLKLFNDISKGIEKEWISNPDLTKVDIKSTIKNNTVTLEQFKFKVKGIRVRIAGTTTFDSRLNLKVRIGLGPFGIIGIPMKITGTMENLRIKYGRGKDKEEDLNESDYVDQLPPELLERIKNAKEDAGEDDEPETPK